MTVRSLGEAPYLDLFEDHTRLRRLGSRSFRSRAADGHSDHPAAWSQLAEHPEIAPEAVEEAMRVGGVVSVIPRVAGRDLELGEWSIPADTLVSLSLAGANHDPAVYADPQRFDQDAARSEGQLGFGGGAHHCLGASLARAEMQEALLTPVRTLIVTGTE